MSLPNVNQRSPMLPSQRLLRAYFAPVARGAETPSIFDPAAQKRAVRALTAHAALDEAEGTSHGWAAQARQLQEQLIPPGLDPNPLATVERLVEDEKAGADGDAGGNDAH